MANEIRSTSKLVDAYERAQGFIARVKAEKKTIVRRGTFAAVGSAGAAASGLVRGMGFAVIPKTQIETDAALGAVAAIAGLMGVGDEYADALLVGGLCMGAPALSRATEAAVARMRGR